MKSSLLKILFIEDLPSDVDLAVLELRKEKIKFEYKTVCNRKDLIEALKVYIPDVIISDYKMPAFNGLQALKIIQELTPDIPFILCTGSVNEETAVECIKAGAQDYIIKEHMTRLPFAVKEALDQKSIQKEKYAADLLLKESEEKLESIFRVAPVGIGLVINRILFEVNDTLCSLLGYSRVELIGKSSEILYPTREEYDRIGRDKYSQIAEKGTGSVETLFKCKSGKILNIVLSSTPIDRNDHSKGVTFTALDITERKKAELALGESEEKFRSIAENLSDVIFITNQEGIIKYISPSVGFFGYSPDECIGRFFGDFMDVGETEKALPFFINALNSVNIYSSVSLVFVRKDRSTFVGELSGSAFRVGNESKGVLGLIRDVTQRKILETATRDSEKRYRELFLNNPVPTYIFDENTLEFVEVNDATVEKYGFSREEFASMTLKDIRLPEDIPVLLESLKELGKDVFHSSAMRHRRKDGFVFPVEIASHSLPDKDGRKTRLVMTRDITERIRAAEQMQLAKEKAEASDKLKTTFLNNISHEVRTPLNGILGFAEIISQTGLSEEEKSVSYAMLQESTDRLLNTITNYMDISLINSGTMSVNCNGFSPDDILRELYANLRIKCLVKNLELILETPERSDKLTISSDQEILRKILTHLLNNAIKFTGKGVIKFGYTIRKNELQFFVKDTGIGIGEESRENVFKNFIKEDRGPQMLSEGSGLGLSISKGLVELLGGRIMVESEECKGSTFFFTLPVEMESGEIELYQDVSRQNDCRMSNSILVAEDDTVNFYYIKALLQKNTSANIIYASNGKEAVDKFRQNPDVGLIIMDIKMPVMDGLEATRQIKAIKQNVPVIAITAYAMVGDEARILNAGCDEYLIKPINKKLFLDKIARYVVMK